MLGDRKTVVLRGGAPWGFRLSGGGQTPVYIAKVRNRSKAALGGLAPGDTIVSINGISSLQQSLREINDVIDTVRDQLILEVQSSPNHRGIRLDSSSSIDTRENSPVRSIRRITPQPQQMDYPHYTTVSSRTTPTYPNYASTSGVPYIDRNNRDQRYTDSYGRSVTNPLPAMFRTATVTSSSPPVPSAATRAQQFSYRPATTSNMYDTPRTYGGAMTSGYISDTNDLRRSSISVRPGGNTASTARRIVNTNTISNNQHLTPPTTYTTKYSAGGSGNDQSYYSDSEYVTAGPRYYKISRQVNMPRRPSNVVLPIRSVTSKAYDTYVPPEQPKPQQQPLRAEPPFDFYRYQLEQQQRLEREQREREQREREQREREQREREQREREKQLQLQRLFFQQQQQQAAARYQPPPKLTLPSQEYGHAPDVPIDHELGAELLKSPLHNKKRYADSSFFQTGYNTYPTIEEQKKMAHKIASILEGGDPTQRGATKFEKQRQRAEKFTLEADPSSPSAIANNYRPLRPMQTNSSPFSNHQQPYYDTPDVPDCIKHSLDEAQYINPLRYVGAPEEFKQMHMQEHVTHTIVPPQVAMSLVADLNQNRGKGAAIFQKRKARSEKWVVDENNVKKQTHQQPTSSYIGTSAKPWGQHAPSSWSGDESSYSGPSFSPVRPAFNSGPSAAAGSIPEQPLSPAPAQPGMKFGDFNAKPKGFGASNSENGASQSPRGSIDARKPLNLNIGPSIREGIAESHTRRGSQPWSPPFNPSALFSPNQQQQQNNNDYFNYPSENLLAKWKNQDYSPWNQTTMQDQRQSQMPMTREGIDNLRQRLTQQNQSQEQQQYAYNNAMQKAFGLGQRGGNSAGSNSYSSSQRPQQHHFTDL